MSLFYDIGDVIPNDVIFVRCDAICLDLIVDDGLYFMIGDSLMYWYDLDDVTDLMIGFDMLLNDDKYKLTAYAKM